MFDEVIAVCYGIKNRLATTDWQEKQLTGCATADFRRQLMLVYDSRHVYMCDGMDLLNYALRVHDSV